jgi:hypothetical protein
MNKKGYENKRNNGSLQLRFSPIANVLNFVIEDTFFVENEKGLEQIGIFFDGKNNIYFLLIAKESLNLFSVYFNLEESKCYHKLVGKIPQKSNRYQASVQSCNLNKAQEVEIIWFLLADTLSGKPFENEVNLNNETENIADTLSGKPFESEVNLNNETENIADTLSGKPFESEVNLNNETENIADTLCGKLFEVKVNLNNETKTINEYRFDAHYNDTTLFMLDNLPCTAGGGPHKRLFTYDKDPCLRDFFLFERRNPLTFEVLDRLYLIGGNDSSQTNLVEFCQLPNFTSPYNPVTYTRNWSSLSRYSTRSVFDNNDLASNINAKDCAACIVGTKVTIFSLDGFRNGYFYTYDVATNVWNIVRLFSHVTNAKAKWSFVNLDMEQTALSFKAIAIFGEIYVIFLQKTNEGKIKLKVFRLVEYS